MAATAAVGLAKYSLTQPAIVVAMKRRLIGESASAPRTERSRFFFSPALSATMSGRTTARSVSALELISSGQLLSCAGPRTPPSSRPKGLGPASRGMTDEPPERPHAQPGEIEGYPGGGPQVGKARKMPKSRVKTRSEPSKLGLSPHSSVG